LVVAHLHNFHKVRRGICRCVEAGPNPPHIRGPWHQNKWSILSGCAAETGNAADIRAISGDLFIFQQDNAPARDGRVTAERGSSSQSVDSQQPQPQPCSLQGVGYDAGP